MKIYKKWFGTRLREIRELAGFKTMAELAERLGVEDPTVWRWEHGQSFPKPKQLERLYKVLNVDEHRFLQFPHEPTKAQSSLALSIAALQEENDQLRQQLEQADWKTQQYEKLKSKVAELEKPYVAREKSKREYALGIITAKKTVTSDEDKLLRAFREGKKPGRLGLALFALTQDEKFLREILDQSDLEESQKVSLRQLLRDLLGDRR